MVGQNNGAPTTTVNSTTAQHGVNGDATDSQDKRKKSKPAINILVDSIARSFTKTVKLTRKEASAYPREEQASH